MIRRILVAVDSSSRAAGVAAVAAELATGLGASLTLFRALSIPPDFPPAAHVVLGDQLPEHLAAEAFQSLEALAAGLPSAVSVTGKLVRVGQPWRTILQVADELDADLIVVGSHGYYGLDRILGTTAGKVANVSLRSVLVVHDRVI